MVGKTSKQGRMKEQQRINQETIELLKTRISLLEKALTESFSKIEKYMKETDERLEDIEPKKEVKKLGPNKPVKKLGPNKPVKKPAVKEEEVIKEEVKEEEVIKADEKEVKENE